MQWGNFYSSHLPITEFDVSLDTESTNPGYRVIIFKCFPVFHSDTLMAFIDKRFGFRDLRS